MIAIVGAKGGCGKTTVTIGLARAFERAGDPAVAVDADRQLPNLHAVADVERTPTLADLGDDVGTVVQPLPDASTAGVIAAPTSADSVDFEAAFDRLAREDVRILLDCPSGAGPDVTDPLSFADAAVVVTTDTERSKRAARTTVEMARRLGVPVLGSIVTKADGVTDDVASTLGVPVLGTVPECEEPLAAEKSREAFDYVAGTLRGEQPRRRGGEGDRLSTGIQPLDAALGGGFPPGSVVALTAAPASQSEHLLYDLTTTRGTLYLTTDRSERSVERAIESTHGQYGTPTVRRLDEPRLESAETLIEKLPEGANLLVDSVNALERADRDAYVAFVNDLADRIDEIGGLAVLCCLKHDSSPANRSVTTHLADAVLDLRTYSAGVDAGIRHTLSIAKLRADRWRTETIDLDTYRTPVTIETEPAGRETGTIDAGKSGPTDVG
ncbi:division plane positioning ATPase MipZ [Natrialbaceae archaeon A-arb3/5]